MGILAKNKSSYKVYLIRSEEATYHTKLTRFEMNDEEFYLLEYNKKVYSASEIEGFNKAKGGPMETDGNLNREASNIMFLDDMGNLSIGSLEFTDRAREVVNRVDSMKMDDRTCERIHQQDMTKFKEPDNSDTLVRMIVFGVIIMLILFVTFQGLPGAITAENNGIDMAKKPAAPVVQLPSPNTTGNGAVQNGPKLEHP